MRSHKELRTKKARLICCYTKLSLHLSAYGNWACIFTKKNTNRDV